MLSFKATKQQFIEDVRQALYASKLVSYAQGYVQLDAAAKEFGWKLNNGSIALLVARRLYYSLHVSRRH